jgi:hypothetical protein
LIVDPKNENKIYKPDLALIMSEDGGKSFSVISGGAHGDFHDVWVNPESPDHLIAGDDGGIWYSYDAGNTWWKGYNLPISPSTLCCWICALFLHHTARFSPVFGRFCSEVVQKFSPRNAFPAQWNFEVM